MPEYITTGQAAKLIGASDDSVVRHAIHQGTLKAQKIGHFWAIERPEFDRWLKDKPHGFTEIKEKEDRK